MPYGIQRLSAAIYYIFSASLKVPIIFLCLKNNNNAKKNKNKVTWLLPENNASFTVLQGGRRHCCDCWAGRWASDPFAPLSCFYKILQTFKNTRFESHNHCICHLQLFICYYQFHIPIIQPVCCNDV